MGWADPQRPRNGVFYKVSFRILTLLYRLLVTTLSSYSFYKYDVTSLCWICH